MNVHIKVKELQPGAILSSDVVTGDGRTLLIKGCCIEKGHIRTLCAWGISAVEIESDDIGPASENAPPLSASEMAEFVDMHKERFMHVDLEHPFYKELFNELVQRQAQNKK